MWKPMQFLTCLTGKCIYSRSRLVLALLFCLLFRTVDAQTATNVDFLVVGSRYSMNGAAEYIYDTIPTGCILFWSIKPDNAERAPIYRSESGHIAFVQNINGVDYLVLADSGGLPMPWFVNSGWRRHYTQVVEGYVQVTKYVVYPHVINKFAYDVIPKDATSGTASYLLYLPAHPVIGADQEHLMARSGNIGFFQDTVINQEAGRVYHGFVSGIAIDNRWGSNGWNEDLYRLSESESMVLRWAFRHSSLIISLDAFKAHLSSKWWLRNKYIVGGNGGITAINIEGGTGMGGYDESTGSGPAAPSSGGVGVGGSVPGEITQPPVTPMGQNGKWVYDPETKLWNWQGDYADNAGQLNPFDNSLMPENQERGLAQEATLRQVKDGVDGLAQESTLQQIRMSMEEFQKQQRITPEQLQSMIDNAVVSIVDGQVQYWEGKNLGAKLDGIDSSVDDSANRVFSAVGSVNTKAQQIQESSATTAQKAGQIATALSPFGNVGNTINQINANIVTSGDSIVNAIEGSKVDLPTTEEQDTEDHQIGEPDFSLLDTLLTFNFPLINIPRVTEFADYDIGVMGWKIPFSHFSQSKGYFYSAAIHRVRQILTWLVYLSATLAIFKAMGVGV